MGLTLGISAAIVLIALGVIWLLVVESKSAAAAKARERGLQDAAKSKGKADETIQENRERGRLRLLSAWMRKLKDQ